MVYMIPNLNSENIRPHPCFDIVFISSHISVALLTVESGSLQLLRLLFQFVIELMDALLSLDNPVTHKYNILFKKALLCRQDMFLPSIYCHHLYEEKPTR